MSDYGMERRGGGRWPIVIIAGATLLALVLMAVAFFGTGPGLRAPARSVVHLGDLKIVASIPPLTWPVRELAPEAKVTVLSGAGASPHGMELTPSQLLAIAEADVVLLVGLGLDDAARRAVEANPREGREVVVLEDALDVAGTTALVHTHGGESGEAHDHAHDHEHDGAHGGAMRDPHAWLDPMVMSVFAGRVDGALARATRGTVTGALALQQRCESIDRTYRIALNAISRRQMVCQHNAYGYLAARYHLDVVGVIQPTESGEVTPGDLKRVVDVIRRRRIGAVFIEPGGTSGPARRVAQETGAQLLTLDPIGNGDWPALMNSNLQVLLEGLSARLPSSSAEPEEEEGAGDE